MDAWPASLPQYFQAGAGDPYAPQKAESSIDGPSNARRRSTTDSRQVRGSIACDVAAGQLTAFESFWRDTLVCGTKPFTWVHPRTGAATVFRFAKPAPSYAPKVSGVVILVNFQLWRLQ